MTAHLTIIYSGVLNLDRVTANGNMIQLNDDAILTNFGTINANMASSNALDLNNNTRVFNNGIMNLTDPNNDPINLSSTAEFTNNGTIYGNDGADGLELGNSTTFYNYGDIYLEGFTDEGVDLDNSTTFVNTGFLSVSDVTNDLICIDGNGDHFINAGIIELTDPGNIHIEVDDGRFTNQEGGVINMSGGDDDGIQLQSSGDFDNYGEININLAVNSSSDDGIEVESSATFQNFNLVNITLTGNGNANAIFLDASSSTFINDDCGVINLLSNHRIELDPGANLTNNGILFTVFNGTHDNQGNFINNGYIDAPNGFMISPNTLIESSDVPAPWFSSTVGNSGTVGNDFGFVDCDARFIVKGGGNNAISTTSDNVAFVSQYLCGNVSITAKIESLDPNGYGGLMIREPEAAGARQVSIFSDLTNVLRHEARYFTNSPKQVQAHYRPNPFWLKLERQGDWFFAYYSTTGTSFQYIHAVNVQMSDCVEVGLASFAFQPGQQTTAVFSNVSVDGEYTICAEGPKKPEVENVSIKLSTKIYPNPAVDLVNLVFEEALESKTTVLLRNQLGQVMEQRQLPPGDVSTEWNMSGLPSGLYFMEVRQEGNRPQVLRVIKSE